jgi:hypothetical protein
MENQTENQDPSRFQIPAALKEMASSTILGDQVPIPFPTAETAALPVVEEPTTEESFDIPEEETTPEIVMSEVVVQPTEVQIRSTPAIDLTNLEIRTSNPMIRSGIIERTFANKPTFMVVCPQSAYVAKLSALCLEDKIKILNSVDNPFESRRKLYKSVYDHIIEMNYPKPTFDNWLKMTSYHDLETLLYGIYAQTYPGESDFDITCGKCENKIDAKIGAHLLQQIKDETAFGYLDLITKSTDPEDTTRSSLVHTTSRILLPDSNIVADIVTPSLSDHLILLKTFNPKITADISNIIGMMLFIKQLYIPDSEKLAREGKAIFFEMTDRNEILKTTSRLSTTDGDFLNAKINERAKQFETNYKLPKMICAACGNDIEAISIDMENLVFSKLLERT